MRLIKMTAPCLLVALALGMLAAAQASAKVPEWGKCEAVASGGHYTDSACTVKARKHGGVYQGGYEWAQLGEAVAEPISLAGTLTFETAAGAKIECATMGRESNVLLEGPSQTKTALWELFGCHSEGEGAGHECTNTEFAGKVSTDFSWGEREYEGTGFFHGWKGQLGFVEGKGTASPVIGLAFTPNNNSRAFEEAVGERTERFIDPPIVCESAIGTVWIGGDREGNNSVISQIAPVDQMTGEFTQTYTTSAPGMQSPERFEGGHGHLKVLRAFIHNHWEPVAIEATMALPIEEGTEPIEIKAVP
jgi:hypothetical protein